MGLGFGGLLRVKGWAADALFGSVTGKSNVSEHQPGEVRPSDTFNLFHADLPAQSTFQKSTLFRSIYRRFNLTGVMRCGFDLTRFDPLL